MCFISMLQIPLFASGCFVIISGFFHALALNGVIPLLIDPCGTLIAAIGMDFSADGFRGCLHCFLVFSLGFLTFCFDEASGLAPSMARLYGVHGANHTAPFTWWTPLKEDSDVINMINNHIVKRDVAAFFRVVGQPSSSPVSTSTIFR